MNVIFLTVSRIFNVEARGIYTDLLRKFRDEGHNVYVVYPRERRFQLPTALEEQDGIHLLGVRTLNIQKTNVVEKGIGTILIEKQFEKAIKRHLTDVNFELILYSTPPITFTNVVKYLKGRNPEAISYLLLKDIFPQNAVDLGMFSKNSLFYKYFRRKEKDLYKVSDYIGCMSPANVDFVLRHNPFISPQKVEIAPNSITLMEEPVVDRTAIRKEYGLPLDKPVFIYGGNLGKPQGVDFLLECLENNKNRNDCYFLIVGKGTEFGKLQKWFLHAKPLNASLLAGLPKEKYDLLVCSCDVGLIFLDHRFTIPNYPSRLLSYLQYRMPIIAATDEHTDVGSIAEAQGYGFYCRSNDVQGFRKCVDKLAMDPSLVKEMGQKGYSFLLNNYLTNNTYSVIVSHFL